MPGQLEKTKVSDVYRHKNGFLYLRVYSPHLGEHFRSLGEREYNRRARAVEREIRNSFAECIKTSSQTNYRNVAEMCFEVKMEGKRDRTIYDARLIYNKLIEAFGKKDISEVSQNEWKAAVNKWSVAAPGKRARTKFQNIRKYAQQIDRFAREHGLKRFKCDFPIHDSPPREGKVISEVELQKLLEQTYSLKDGQSLRLFLLLGYYMGMRRNEILRLSWDRVDLKKREIFLRACDTKNNRARAMAIARQVMPALLEQKNKSKNEWVFPSRVSQGPIKELRASLNEICEKAKIRVRPHDLRHSFLTRKACIELVDPLSLSLYAGVSVSTIERVYLHPSMEDTKHVVE